MLGLAESGRSDMIEDMVRNFAYLIDPYGHVPNGARTYFSADPSPRIVAVNDLVDSREPRSSHPAGGPREQLTQC